jgi:hypothetical protein
MMITVRNIQKKGRTISDRGLLVGDPLTLCQSFFRSVIVRFTPDRPRSCPAFCLIKFYPAADGIRFLFEVLVQLGLWNGQIVEDMRDSVRAKNPVIS